MRIALFVPCYVDQFYPWVAIAALEFLEHNGVTVDVPSAQTCCGQPMANSGCEDISTGVYEHFVSTFRGYDYIVTPSGSCAYHVKKHFDIIDQTEDVMEVRDNIFEFVSFVHDVLGIHSVNAPFPFKVGMHTSCHGQRGLKSSTNSEMCEVVTGSAMNLLKSLTGIELVSLDRPDECCGFGGTFCVAEEAVSSRMGSDRVSDHLKNGTQILTSTDMSCLMHLDGIVRRRNLPMKVMHIAEILNGNQP